MRNVRFGSTLAISGLVLALGAAAPALAGGGGGDINTNLHNNQVRCEECMYVDTYNPADPTNQVTDREFTTGILKAGALYEVVISGTASYWSPAVWTAPEGTPEAAPMFPSLAGAMTGPAGVDWEYLYAYPTAAFTGSFPFHYQYGLISLDGGATFFDNVPVDGQTYQSSHEYRYVVVGQGMKAGFERIDQGPTHDNYGRFLVCVHEISVCNKKDDRGSGDDHCPGSGNPNPSGGD